MDWRQILIVLLIFLPLERLLPNRAEQPILRGRWKLDAVYFVVNDLLIRIGFVVVLVPAMWVIDRVVPEGVQAWVAALPLWLQVLAAILIADLGFYVHHRLFHSIPALWRIHAIHHSIEELDWLAAHRVHPVDRLTELMISLLPLFALGITAEAIAIYSMIYLVHSHLLHSNTSLGFGPLDGWIASPRFHHWHHANAPEAFDTNYGAQTLIWDRLFGTLHLPQPYPARYGTDDPVPDSYPSQLMAPFKIRRRRFA